jgi:outer membrane lipoprotein SlyB
MNTTLVSPPLASSSASSTKPLWAAVGVLGVCVLAMGATLVHVNQRPEPLAQASIPLASAQAALPSSLTPAATPALTPAGTPMITEKSEEKAPAAGTKPAQNAPKTVAKAANPAPTVVRPTAPTTAPVAVTQPAAQAPVVVAQAPMPSAEPPAPVVVQAPAKPACTNCGTIESVTPITRQADGSGVGVVAGGVLGGVVGNQIGKGSGRAVATVLGAIGGGVAGNAIEKNMKKTTVYNVRIRMEDGSTRSIEHSSAPLVGSKVTLDGNTMRPA